MYSRIHHPNVVLFIGACFAPLCIVLEFINRGSLFDVLRKRGETEEEFTFERKMKVLTGAARGMAYLHANGLIHVCAMGGRSWGPGAHV